MKKLIYIEIAIVFGIAFVFEYFAIKPHFHELLLSTFIGYSIAKLNFIIDALENGD